ncbi:MAG: radical SAM protein [Candidatus Omnitrophica bacterium]|nr:radical SAM protein [Candidatus Omnitrophota bacterium]
MSTATYQDLIKKTAKKLIPIHCLFELTYNCNLSCVHCYVIKNEKKELNEREAFDILKQLKDAGCLYLTLSGGEIFVRKDFFEIAGYARKLNFALRLFTNGTLVNGKVADKIKALKPISVEISLYGFKNIHEKITQVKRSFDKAVRAIKLLVDRNIKVFVKTTLMKQNIDEIWKLKEFVGGSLKAGWRGIGGELLISPCDDGNRRPLNYRLDDEQLKNYIREEIKISKISKSFEKEFKPRKVKRNETLCGAGFVSCNITPYGELNPCVQIRLENNSLKDKSFMEIWKGHKEIRALRNMRMADKEDCWGCELISYCFVCPGVALLESGSLTAKLPEACRQARIKKEIYEEITTSALSGNKVKR